MNSAVQVRSLKGGLAEYSLLIGAVGFETRARHALKMLSPVGRTRIAVEFEQNQFFDFAKNREAFKSAGFSLVPANEMAVEASISNWMNESEDEAEPAVWLDISSLTRSLLARICFNLFVHAARKSKVVRVHFAYSRAEFSAPPADYGPIVHAGAVIPELAGWSDDPSQSCTAIFGVGYEAGLSLGAIEQLEPAEGWAFRPTGHEAAYDRVIDKSNGEFFRAIEPSHILNYKVDAPFQLYSALESIVYGSLRSRRVIIVPFGLKIFALCSCLVALQHCPRVAVWRVSGGSLAIPINRIAKGPVAQLEVVFDGMGGSENCTTAIGSE